MGIFKEIKNEYQSYELPFDEADWNDLVARLDKKEQKKAVFFISRRLYIPAAAAVAAGLILLVSVLPKKSKNDHIAAVSHEAVSNNIIRKDPPVIENKTPNDRVPAANSVFVASFKHQERKTVGNSVIVKKEITAEEDTSRPLPAPSENVVESNPMNIYVNKNNKPANYPKEVEWEGMEPKATSSNLRVAANGGLNYNTSKLGYSIGASISKSISKKIAIQADMAFVDNSRQLSYSQMNVTERQVVGLTSVYTEYDTSYQKTTKDYKQNYAQVALSVDLSLTQSNSVCVGVDVQRLLNGEQKDDRNNSSFQKASTWNSGVLLRYRHDLNQKLSLGLSYRQDVTSAIQNTWQNNALQVYFNYYIKSK